jgi:hypothetical protein
MQEKTRSLSQFIKKVLNIRSSKQAPPSPEATTSFSLYHNINELPFRNFIQVVVYENIYALIISGKPDEETLLNAWINIRSQFADAIGDSEHKVFTSVFKEVALLSATYKQLTVLIDLLSMLNTINVFAEDLYKELNATLRSDFKFAEGAQNKNAELLKKCRSRSKGIKLQLDLKEAHLNALSDKQTTGKPTIGYYQSLLITLGDHCGYQLTDDISTFEFCERMRRFKKYCEQVKPKQHGGR